jgi:hypothetical protein
LTGLLHIRGGRGSYQLNRKGRIFIEGKSNLVVANLRGAVHPV